MRLDKWNNSTTFGYYLSLPVNFHLRPCPSAGWSGKGHVLAPAGSYYLFTPDADFHGLASFDYTIRDQAGNLSTATASVRIVNVNDAPILKEMPTATIKEEGVIAFTPEALLALMEDKDGDQLTIGRIMNAAGGAIMTGAGGAYIFAAAKDYNGMAGFDYEVADGRGGTTREDPSHLWPY